jgi:outer membrane protein assembly factor BamB
MLRRLLTPISCFLFVGLVFAQNDQPTKPEKPEKGEKVATWTQWRGPNRSAVLENAPAWPDKLDKDSITEVWRIKDLGPSYSGPIVSETAVFTTQTKDKKFEVVTAHDRKTGKELWSAKWEGSMSVPFFAAKNGSWIRATPALDGDRLYVGGIKDLLVCLDAKTGKELWKFDFVKEFKASEPTFGFVSSPFVDATGVYVQAGGAVAKLNKETGKEIWRSLKDGGGMNGSAFSSVVPTKLAGKDQLLVLARTKMAGLDRETGKELWTKDIPSFRGMNILTPVAYGDEVFTSTYGGTTQAFKVVESGDGLRTENGWSFKYEGNMSTPVIVKDHAYFLGKDRKAICVNLKTGKETWRSEKGFGEYWNLVANGDKILALDNRGTIFLLKANPKEMEILSEYKIADGETWAHIAVCGDEIFIRDLYGLTCFRWAAKK